MFQGNGKRVVFLCGTGGLLVAAAGLFTSYRLREPLPKIVQDPNVRVHVPNSQQDWELWKRILDKQNPLEPFESGRTCVALAESKADPFERSVGTVEKGQMVILIGEAVLRDGISSIPPSGYFKLKKQGTDGNSRTVKTIRIGDLNVKGRSRRTEAQAVFNSTGSFKLVFELCHREVATVPLEIR